MTFRNCPARRDRLRHSVRQAKLAAILVSNPVHVTYLTGFTGDASFLLLDGQGELLVTDSRFTVQLQEECPDLELLVRDRTVSLCDATAEAIKKRNIKSVGVESGHLTVDQYEKLASALIGTLDSPPVATTGTIEALREIKDGDEIAAIRVAVAQAEKAFEAIRAMMTGEQTERHVAADIEHAIRRFGGQGCSFPAIVGVGDRGALPHAPPTTRRIDEGEFVLIDWGARVGAYVSDLTRVLVTGKLSAKLAKVYEVVLRAQQQAIEAIRPGVSMESVDAAARSVIADAGYGSKFGHGLGHGIGLEVHEAPRLVDNNPCELRAGMVVTVEPGIYLPGWGGVRIEDDVLVTRDGHEVLSSIPKELEACVVSV